MSLDRLSRLPKAVRRGHGLPCGLVIKPSVYLLLWPWLKGSWQSPRSCQQRSICSRPFPTTGPPKAFEKHFNAENEGLFRWLTKDRTRAKLSPTLYSNTDIQLTIFEEDVPIEEVIADFSGGKLNLVTVSIYNRGDGATITLEDFKTRQIELFSRICG